MTRTDDLVELSVESVAHGGHCVARLDGQVVFVRHTLPGERVRARITGGDGESSFLRADAVEILEAAPGRVESGCSHAGPGGCGGCDFQHVDLATQRELLGAVVREQFRRLAKLDVSVTVEAPEGDGFGWRTRVAYGIGVDGRAGLRRHRSNEVIPIDDCPIAHPGLPDVSGERFRASSVTAVVSSAGERLLVLADGVGHRPPAVEAEGIVSDGKRLRGRTHVREQVRGREFRITADGFWQVHPQAASMLVDAVLDAAEVRPGDRVADLYSGAGLFTAFLASETGPEGSVTAIEGAPDAVRDARRNVHDLPQVKLVASDVARTFRRNEVGDLDVVVLDPPRVGAKAKVVRGIAASAPRRVVYVACDPAALARDVATFAEEGYVLTGLRAFDLFPMTHHVECVAVLEPTIGGL